MSSGPLIFLIVGEASGDALGGRLMRDLKQMPGVRFMGIGGPSMKAEGLKSLFPMEELSHMGVWSILKDLPNLYGRLRYTIKTIKDVKPDTVITIDAPEFSLRVMKSLHKLPSRPKLVHYVAPTVWAWRPGMAPKVAKFLDHLLCLYPFEPPLFEKHGLKATFVGHPIAKMSFKKRKRDPNLLCVLPGSRRSELDMFLPVFRETVSLLKKDMPDLKVIIPTLPSFQERVAEEVKSWPVEVKVVVGDAKRDEAFERSWAALAASGTVALQLAAARLPFVVAYRLGTLSGKIARFLIKTPYACMVNVLLGYDRLKGSSGLPRSLQDLAMTRTPWIPEFIQENCTPDKIAPSLVKLFKDSAVREHQVEAMQEALGLLKAPDLKGVLFFTRS